MVPSPKARKPYTVTKSRESWHEAEHLKFLQALQLFDRDWKKIENFVGSKTVIQIRSHAQKYFLKVQKNGTIAHVPPPRPKKKAAHPYPQKASKNAALMLLPTYVSCPESMNIIEAEDFVPVDEMVLLEEPPMSETALLLDEFPDVLGAEVDVALKEAKSRMWKNFEGEKQGLPDFNEVYSFIGSVFDSKTVGHVERLNEMDQINFETVLLLMSNLTINLSCPDFEPIVEVLSSLNNGNARMKHTRS